jgi:hypothetical protein
MLTYLEIMILQRNKIGRPKKITVFIWTVQCSWINVHSERKCNFGPSNVYMIFLFKEKKTTL